MSFQSILSSEIDLLEDSLLKLSKTKFSNLTPCNIDIYSYRGYIIMKWTECQKFITRQYYHYKISIRINLGRCI